MLCEIHSGVVIWRVPYLFWILETLYMRCFQTAYPPALSARGVTMSVQDNHGKHFCFHKFEYVRFLHFCRRSHLTRSMQLHDGIPLMAALFHCLHAVPLLFFLGGSWRPEFLFFTILVQSLFSWITIIIFEACLYVHRNRSFWKSCVLRYPWFFFWQTPDVWFWRHTQVQWQ